MNPAKIGLALGRLLLVAGVLILPGCKTLQLASDWTREQVEADGESGEWLPVSPGWLNVENLQVAARNDAEHLHLMVRFRADDARWARPCGMAGMTVWLDPAGKKARKTGFRLAAGPRQDSLTRPGGAGEELRGMPPGRGPGPRGHDGMLVFLDRAADTTAILPPDGALGVRAGFASDGGICSYEFSFPLVAAGGRYGLGIEPGGSVMVGLATGPDREEREAMRERVSERSGGGPPGGGKQGGGPPGGGPRGGGQRRSEPENPELWFKLTTAPAEPTAGGES